MNEPMAGSNIDIFPDENIEGYQSSTQKLLSESQQLLLQAIDVVKECSWERSPNVEEALRWINLAQGRIEIKNIDDLLHQLDCILMFMRITPVKEKGRSKWGQIVSDLKKLISKHKPRSTAQQIGNKVLKIID